MKKAKSADHCACVRSLCPMASALDLLGDKWSLLVVRDMLFLDKRLYGDFMQSPEGIPSNILAERLRRLEKSGLIAKRPYQNKPLRHAYYLTKRGRDLYPVLKEIARWGITHIPGAHAPPPGYMEAFEKKLAAARKPPRAKR